MSRADDELAIRSLVARLAHEADMGTDVEDYAALFTQDAVWELPDTPPRIGREAIREGAVLRRAAGGVGPGSETRHVISTQAIEVRGDEATSDAYFLFYENTASQPRLKLMGHYRDTLRREGGHWKLAHRRITIG